MRKQKGFTLIELLIVIAIIGLLAALALVSLTAAQKRARDTKRVADMKSFQTALELYYNEEAEYPILVVEDAATQEVEVNTWPEMAETMASYISSLSTPPQPDKEVYTYIVNATADQYYIRTVLEDKEHQVLSQDLDGAALGGAGWMSVSSDSAFDPTDATIDCGVATANTDGMYCLGGTAAQ